MAARSATIAKIARPVPAGLFPRRRVFRLLDRARSRLAVWVSGPPGSGKTAAVSGYVAARKIPCIWFQADEGDADLATLFHYLGEAARKAAPKSRRPLPALTPECLPDIPAFARRFFGDFFAGLRPGSLVVFDNCHTLPADSAFFAAVREGLSRLPAGMTVVLVSRTPPHAAFAGAIAGRRMGSIGWKDLRLTRNEVAGIIRMRKERGKRAAAGMLHRKTGGWVAGLVLLLENAARDGTDAGGVPRRTPAEMFDYFAGEILDRTDEETRSFLLKTSFLPRMTARMAERLTGNRRAGSLLAGLDRNNYFTDRLEGGEPVFGYHSLFREFLVARAAGSFSRPEIARIKRRAASVLVDEGLEEDAVVLLRETGDRDALAAVIRKLAPLLVRQGRWRTLLEWMEALPAKRVKADPWLQYWTAVCRLPFFPGESRVQFEEAYRAFGKGDDAAGLFLAWSGIVEAIMYGADGLAPLDRWLPVPDELLAGYGGFPSDEVAARVASSMVRALALRRPEWPGQEAWTERALAIARQSPDISSKVETLANLAGYRYAGGELHDLEVILDSLKESLRGAGVPLLARLTANWVEAAYANLTAQFDRCLASVSDGLALSGTSGIRVVDHLLLGQGALASLKTGDASAARGFLRRMGSSLAAAKPWEASFFHYLVVWESLAKGDAARAAHHAARCLDLCAGVGNPWTLAAAHLAKAFACDETGDGDARDRHVEAARMAGERSRNDHVRFSCLLAAAYFALRRGDDAAALRPLREGIRIGRERGYSSLYLWRPGLLETLAAKALDAGIEMNYVGSLIRKNAVAPPGGSASAERWPWALSVRTLGGFELFRDGEPVRFHGKVQQKPLAMLKALIALGGREVPEDRLTDILWPDADGDQAHQSFATTLKRLRRLVGDERFLPFRDGRLSLDERSCWVDAWALERSGTGPAGDDACRELALSVYRGPFLPGETAPWAVPCRERLRSRFLRCVAELGLRHQNSGLWDKAIACYERGLDADDLAEDLYARLIGCYARLGRKAEALAAYERCRKTLSAVLGVKPSARTEALVASLLSG